MKIDRLWIGLAVGSLVTFAAPSAPTRTPLASAQQAATLQRWEYKCFTEGGAKNLEHRLNELGAQSWEPAFADASLWCLKRPSR